MKKFNFIPRWAWFSLLAILLLVIDQIIKLEVKTGMNLHESIRITDWFYISFIENNGMAYGMTFIPKTILTLLRIIAVGFLIYYMRMVLKRNGRTSYLVCLTLVLAGAAGNIFDSMFYGLIFSKSTLYDVAQFVPFGEGYETFLNGRVVDMFYFPIFSLQWPEWMPFIGGKDYTFFSAIFNFADACISVGMVLLILFFRKDMFWSTEEKKEPEKEVTK